MTPNPYVDFFIEMNRFAGMLVTQMQKNLLDFYVDQLNLYNIKLVKMPKFDVKGKVTQCLSHFSSVSTIFGRPYDSNRVATDSTPSVRMGQTVAAKVGKADVGLIVAPNITTQRDAVTKIIPVENRTDILDRYVRTPWKDFTPFNVYGDRSTD